jgi:hypothetical protein
MMDTDQIKKGWAEIMAARTEVKPAPTKIPEQCIRCGSKNLFCGGGNVKCNTCGKITPLIERKINDLDLPQELAEEQRKAQKEFLESHRGNHSG